jgi:hypothetical protein
MINRERKPNSFVLFKNNQKQEEKHPDYSGTLTDENGKNWRIAGWVLESKNSGIKYLGGKISEFLTKQQIEERANSNGGNTANAVKPKTDDEHDLPF